MKLDWSDRARQDLHGIHAYIARDNGRAARRWLTRIRSRARAATDLPMAGRMVPELERPDVREVFVGAYRIVYRIADESLLVLTVFDGHKLFPGAVEAALDDE